MDEISETSIPFPHRSGNLYKIQHLVFWDEEGNEASKRHISWIRRLYDYLTPYVSKNPTPYVSKNPREAYVNYRDLDIGMNNLAGNTSYKQASIWGRKYFKNNFDKLVRVKTAVDPANFFRNEQSIPPLSSWKDIEVPTFFMIPYGGKMDEISESSTPFPHRAGNRYIFVPVLSWSEETKEASQRHLAWIRRLYRYMTPYVSKNPRQAYVNYRDLDLGVNNLGYTSYKQASMLYRYMTPYVSKNPRQAYVNYRDLDLGVNNLGYTSYKQASIWGRKYFKNNFDRLVRVKTEVDPTNFFRNEQSIPPLSSW
ncbi:hypothetical protein NC652_028567 [Populus alba x Populus x berolinensis]|nr:hypothetical protein NC652_028567 [Populus alba x Populus x berolinensis]